MVWLHRLDSRRLAKSVPDGTGLRVQKTVFWWAQRSSFCSIGGRRLKLSDGGTRMGVSLSDIQMCSVLMAALDSMRMHWRIRERSPGGPPRGRGAYSSCPRTESMIWGVQALTPMKRRVRRAKIFAMMTGFCSVWDTFLHQCYIFGIPPKIQHSHQKMRVSSNCAPPQFYHHLLISSAWWLLSHAQGEHCFISSCVRSARLIPWVMCPWSWSNYYL